MVLQVLKRAIERSAVRSGLTAGRIRRRTPSTVILAYHNVVPHGERPIGDISLHIDQARFAGHLDLLMDSHSVVPLRELLSDEVDPLGRPRAILTFDDAYVGAITAGADELSSRGLEATVFVPPGLLGAEAFWWDLLAPDPKRPLDDKIREHALWRLEGRQDHILDWATSESLELADVPPHARPASPEELERAVGESKFSLGSHTWSHANLAALSSSACLEEVVRGHEWLEGAGPATVDWLAYPYGLRSPEVVEAVSSTVEAAVLVDGSLAQANGKWSSGRFEVPRVNVPSGLTEDGLSLRLAGLV